jgi:hypothetical protein
MNRIRGSSERGRGRADRAAVRGPLLALLVGLAVNASCVALASGQDASQSQPSGENGTPLPPRQPSLSAPTPAPAVTAQQPAQQATSEAAAAQVWKPGKLLQLPPYTRARMHECALEWQKMKENGTTGEKIWFIFAQSCLVQ